MSVDPQRIDQTEGRVLFGLDPTSYDAARPDYPAALFDALATQGALYPGAATLEIGAGSGIASRRLLAAGASPLTLLEPDTRFAAQLDALAAAGSAAAPGSALRIRHETFEAADLDPAGFDLAVVATAFHWLDPACRVARLAELVRPGGHVALLWNVFHDPGLADPFHEATRSLLAGLAVSPSGAPDELPFALDRTAREREFLGDGRFVLRLYVESHWTLPLSAGQVRELYGGFSSVARLPAERREALLAELSRIAREQFGGTIQRNMTSPLYLFRRQHQQGDADHGAPGD
jgi:SAM-dependent methyltransferase